jgi:DNA-binding response OmpR family regulator
MSPTFIPTPAAPSLPLSIAGRDPVALREAAPCPPDVTNEMNRVALIVEDDPVLQHAMAKRLEKANFRVLTALHFNAALVHLNATKFDVACIDLGLPNESGYELCEHIRNRLHLASLPILVTSERCFPEDMAHAEEAGANAFLKKPFPMDRVLKYVFALLDGPQCSQPSLCRLRLGPVAAQVLVA